MRRLICRIRGHAWSNEKSSVNPGYWCDRCKRFLAPGGQLEPADTSSGSDQRGWQSPEAGAKDA